MDEAVEADEVVDDDLLHFLQVGLHPVLALQGQVLRQQQGVHVQLLLAPDEGLLHDDDPLHGLVAHLHPDALLAAVVDGVGRQGVQEVGLVEERRLLARFGERNHVSDYHRIDTYPRASWPGTS